MSKFTVGESVQIKQGYPMAGYIGIITKYSEKNHTYLIQFGSDQKIVFLEKAFEVKKA